MVLGDQGGMLLLEGHTSRRTQPEAALEGWRFARVLRARHVLHEPSEPSLKQTPRLDERTVVVTEAVQDSLVTLDQAC